MADWGNRATPSTRIHRLVEMSAVGTKVLLIAAVLVSLLTACGKRDDAPSGVENIGKTKAALSQQLSVSTPAGTSFMNVALGTSETLRLHDRARVVTPDGGFAEVTNTGTVVSAFDVNSRVGDVTSVAPVSLEQGTQVTGSVTSGGSVTQGAGVVVTGSVTSNATLTPPAVTSWDVDPPPATEAVVVYPGQSRALDPGSYTVAFVYYDATLSLSAGTYHFDQLSLEQLSTLSLDTSGGPIFIYVRTSLVWRGAADQHAAEDLLVGYFGALPVVVETGFKGTLVAPSAPVRLGIGGPAHSGSVFAKTIELDADSIFTYRPFGHWGTLFPPTPFVTCVSQVGLGVFAALFGYESQLPSSLDIPLGSRNFLEPATTLPERQPPTTFQPGRVNNGFWSLLDSTSLTWNLGGQSVTATPNSPGCDAVAYAGGGEHPSSESPSPPVARKEKLIPYFLDAAHEPGATELFLDANTVENDSEAFSAPFGVTLTKLRWFADPINSPITATVSINGESVAKQVFVCPDFQTCRSINVELNEHFANNVLVDQPTVDVTIEISHVFDPLEEPTKLTASLVVDNQTGTWTGSVNSPVNCQTHDFSDIEEKVLEICWTIGHTGVPPVPPTVLCPKWNTDYVDEGLGEQIMGERSSLAEPALYPARYTEYILRLTGPLEQHVEAGFLDKDGCIELDETSSRALIHLPEGGTNPAVGGLALSMILVSRLETPDGIRYELRSFPAGSIGSLRISTENVGDVPLDTWTQSGAWRIPPPVVPLRVGPSPDGGRHGLMPFMNLAATIGTVLSTDDTGIVPGTYHAKWGGSPCFNGDSCVAGDTLYIGGPSALPDPVLCDGDDSQCESVQQCLGVNDQPCLGPGANCQCKWPDQARWKFVIAHETGHQVQIGAMGSFEHTGYTFKCLNPPCSGVSIPDNDPNTVDRLIDPPFVDQTGFCGCQHVKAANGLHCLQSVERSPAAQIEGFAQFFASRIWNQRGSTDCTFVYYKEFLDNTCRALDPDNCEPNAPGQAPGIVTLPPLGVDCASPIRWRNNNCPISESAEMGTELDWMGFLWNLNGAGALSSPMTDIWQIYRHACNPPPAGQPPLPNPPNCRADQPISWNERPITPVPGDPPCRERDDCGDVPAQQVCADATPGSDTQCDISIPTCVCKFPLMGGFLAGANRLYENDPARAQNVEDRGNEFGVSQDLTP